MKLAAGPAKRRPYFGVLELELAAMLEQWDVLGVYGTDAMPAEPTRRTAQQHEYDDLVRPIIAHLMNADGESAFATALVDVLQNEYGVSLEGAEDQADARSFASSVMGWWRSR